MKKIKPTTTLKLLCLIIIVAGIMLATLSLLVLPNPFNILFAGIGFFATALFYDELVHKLKQR